MREKQEQRPGLFDAAFELMDWMVDPKKNAVYAELEAIDKLLDEMPQILDDVYGDVCLSQSKTNKHKDTKPVTGRRAEINCEQALRCAILKQLKQYSYRELAGQIEITPIYRKFTRFHASEIPHYSTIERVIKRISGATMQKACAAVVALGIKKKVEDGRALRHDTTVVESDIAHPVDARLLNDSVRVLTRLTYALRQEAPELAVEFHDRTRRSKKRAYQIVMAKGKNVDQRRAALYKDLFKAQQEVVAMAQKAVDQAKRVPAANARLVVLALAGQLERFLGLARQVYSQAHRRVVKGEQVPADEKLVSIFETHTDIICRGKSSSPTEFGHKVDCGIGKSGLVTRYEVLEGNPGDNEVVGRALQDHQKTFGKVPQKFVTDRRYFSAANEQLAHGLGVELVAMPKPGHLNAQRQELQRQPWFRRLLAWRAGIEGCLSTLLRSFGLKRCLWKGLESFKTYVGLSVLTYNLRLLAGHVAKI